MLSSFPISPSERDRWILERRPERNLRDPWQPYAFLCEPETGPAGLPVPVATVFLTNRECPYRCLMCDLWRDTLTETVPPGAIAAQVRYALERLPPARWLKLYNAGSFFDPRAIPEAEYEAVVELAAPFERVVVECHPALVGPRTLRFRDLLALASGGRARLEVAMGLETIHPDVLPRLNKRMTLEQFRSAAELLAREGISLRTFLLLRPPWLSEMEGLEWAFRSLEFAAECGAEVCAVIPTRAGNGALEELGRTSEYAPPALSSLEVALEYGLRMGGPRVFADLWDAERFATCRECSPTRLERLSEMNETQSVPPPILCPTCGEGVPAS